ncbi:MAG TPA: hypothetical protein DCM86_13405, partial [Verrucomicrobiales bacterium]|nr:hypothetical protein [Verrucomicrobiales bacterium]
MITTQPVGGDVFGGDPFSMTVVVTGNEVTFQWYRNGVAIPAPVGTNVVLTIPSAGPDDAGAYQVDCTNDNGTTSSDLVSLNVILDPTFITQPADVSVNFGQSATFSAVVKGMPPLFYQWWFAGAPIPDGTNTTYTIPAAQLSDAGAYSLEVYNDYNDVFSLDAILTVHIPGYILDQPIGAVVGEGDPLTLSVLGDGDLPLSYQWYFNGVLIPGATADSYSLVAATLADTGDYTVRVSNPYGGETSLPAHVDVLQYPSFNPQPQPLALTVPWGGTAVFTAGVQGSLPLIMQWYQEGSIEVTGATGPVLTLSNVTTNEAGAYTLTVANPLNIIASDPVTLTVREVPGIVTGPVSKMVVDGATVSFSVVADGRPTLQYQWMLGGVDIPGATSATLTLVSVHPSNNGNYSVRVSNAQGSVTSGDASLTVIVPPSITSQPADRYGLLGGTTTFTVGLSGTAPFGLQWFKNGTTLIPGATSASFTLPSLGYANNGTYSLVISNFAGVVTSRAALLTVLAPPQVTTQPASQSIPVNSPVTFTVGNSGDAPIGYQWIYNGTTPIAGATSSSYTIPSVQVANGGTYSVTVTNPVGTATSSAATLTVIVPPTISSQPSTLTVNKGDTASFSVTATAGNGHLSYQWKLNGTSISGATAATLSIPAAQQSNEGTYTVLVTNEAGSLLSSQATLTVVNPPLINTQPATQTVAQGATASFSVVADAGHGVLAYQWKKGAADVVGATSATLTIPNAQQSDEGSYTVVVRNSAGSLTSAAAGLTVVNPPIITAQPSSTTVARGTVASFTVSANPGHGVLSYQWYKGPASIPGATSASLSIANAQQSDEGSYTVVVTNLGGNVTSAGATLTVVNPPVITSQPVSITVVQGTTALFSVGADAGHGVLSYQWKKGGTAIPGAIAATLSIPNAQPADEALYTVDVSNLAGLITSSGATLTVIVPPTISLQPANVTLNQGQTATFTVGANANHGTLTYQWKKGAADVVGATSATLTIPNAQQSDEGSYTVVVNNEAGNITSAAATLTV